MLQLSVVRQRYLIATYVENRIHPVIYITRSCLKIRLVFVSFVSNILHGVKLLLVASKIEVSARSDEACWNLY